MLRFNTRGTTSVQGTSQGTFDNGVGEQYDVAAAIEYVEFAELPNIWVVGWSFGTDLALMYANDPGVEGLDPAVAAAAFGTDRSTSPSGRESGKPVVAIVPEFDDYLRPAEAEERFAAIPQAEVIGVPDGKHLWVGQADQVLDLIVERLNPAAAPLPADLGRPDGRTRRRRSSDLSADRRARALQVGVLSCGGNDDLADQQEDGRGGRDREQRADDAEQRAADQHRDHGDHAGDVDRRTHHARVDHVVLELLVDDVEDDAGDPDPERRWRTRSHDDDGRRRSSHRSAG